MPKRTVRADEPTSDQATGALDLEAVTIRAGATTYKPNAAEQTDGVP